MSAQTRFVEFEIIDSTGTVRVSGANTIAPGGIGGAGGGGSSMVGQFYCRFIAPGQKVNYRASIAVRSNDGLSSPDLLSLPAD